MEIVSKIFKIMKQMEDLIRLLVILVALQEEIHSMGMEDHRIHLGIKEEALRTEDPLILYFLGAIKTDPHQITRVANNLKIINKEKRCMN